MQKRSKAINVAIPSSVALYILNNQRPALEDIENKYQLAVTLETDDTLIPPDYRIERVDGGKVQGKGETAGAGGRDTPGEGGRRRRRSRRHRHGEETAVTAADEAKTAKPLEDAPEEPVAEKAPESKPESDEEAPPARAKRRRRGRRGGRRRGRKPADRQVQDRTGNAPPAAAAEAETSGADDVIPLPGPDAPTAAEAPAENKSPRGRKAKDPAKRSGGIKTKKAETAAGKPARRPRRSAKAKEAKPAGEKSVINIPIQTPDEASPPATMAEPAAPARQAAASTGGDGAKTNVIHIGGVAGDKQAPGKSQGRKGWWNKPAK